jgi:hypothetical protein
MARFGVSAAALLAWRLALAFLGAGAVRRRLGRDQGRMRSLAYPRWWNLVTGGLEALAAAPIALPAARVAGLTLGAAICVAAVATVVRHKDYGRVAPGAVPTALSALDLALLVG